MNTRTYAIIGGIAGAIGLIGYGLYEPAKETHTGKLPAAAQAKAELPRALAPVATDEAMLAKAVELFNAAGDDEKLDALDALSDAVADADELGAEPREKIARAVIDAYDGYADDDTQAEFQLDAAKFLASIGGTAADEKLAELLGGDADEGVRVGIVKTLAVAPGGHDKDVYAAALDAIQTDSVPAEFRPAILRRALGRKSKEPILALFDKGDASPATMKACAVALQDVGDKDVFGHVLERLDARGMLDGAKTMPWLSGKLLSDYVKTANSEQWARAIKAVQARPGLAKFVMPAARERLADNDPAVRRMIARLVPHAVKNDGLDAKDGEAWLSERLGKENDPAVKGALEDSLAQVRSSRPPQQGENSDPTMVR